MVKCKSNHMFAGIDVKLKETFTILPKGVSIQSSCLLNLNGQEQLMLTTSTLDVLIFKLPDLAQTATFKIPSPATVCFASSLLQNTLFFGLTNPSQYGQAPGNI